MWCQLPTVASPARQFSPAMQISSISFISLEIYCFRTQSTVNICIAGLNHRAGYATDCQTLNIKLHLDPHWLLGVTTRWHMQTSQLTRFRRVTRDTILSLISKGG